MFSSIKNFDEEINRALLAGAFIIVEDAGLRLRLLPVKKND